MRKSHLALVTTLFIMASIASVFQVLAEEGTGNIVVTHENYVEESGDHFDVWGQVNILNNGESTVYVSSVTYIIQSEHARWVTILSDGIFSVDSIAESVALAPGEGEAFSYSTPFYPETGVDVYRLRVIVEVTDPSGTNSKLFSDVEIDLSDTGGTCPINPSETPMATNPPTTSPPTTAPPGVCPTDVDDGCEDNDGNECFTFELQDVRAHIINIDTDISEGGYAVCVDVEVYEGTLDRSSLYIMITTKNEKGWIKVFEDSMNIEVEGGLTQKNTPLTFCFEGIWLNGDIEDYEACIQWRQGYVGEEGPIISRQCINFHQIPAIDIVTYGVILATLAVIATVAVYIKRPK